MRVPLHEVLETLLVLKNGTEAAETDPFERIVAVFDQVEQDLDPLDVQKVQLGALIPVNGVLQAIKRRQDECGRVARLVNLAVLHVVFEDLNAALPSEHFLVFATVLANVRQNVEGELTDV